MTPHQAIAVAVRLFALWVAIHIPGLAYAALSEGGGIHSGFAIAATAIIITIGALIVIGLWKFPQTIARGLLSVPESGQQAPASPDTWLAMGCALIGLWLVATCLPPLARDLLFLYSAAETGSDTANVKYWLITYVVQFICAAWLIFGSRGLLKLYWWARLAGTKSAL